jgi:vacuolar-type H+-ATPase subunit E/Vma4
MNAFPSKAEAIKKEILAAAGRQAAAEEAQAGAEEEKLLAAAAAEAAGLVAARSAEARAAAARRREALLASVALEAGRLRAELEEARLEAVRAGAEARLAAAGGLETAAGLAAAAIASIDGSAFTVKVSPVLAAEGRAGLAGEIARRAARGDLEIIIEPDPGCRGGALVLGSGGRQRWDNTLGARLARLWPGLRCRFAAGEKGEG